MDVLLNSRDVCVFEVCRRALESLGRTDLNLTWKTPEDPPTVADLNIWDVEETLNPAHIFEDGITRPNVILASREQTASLRELLPDHAATILLKPLTEGPLRVCLEHALNAKKLEPNGVPPNDQRLLQFTLEATMKLQEYDQDRTNFIARAVHDFRAPLTALKGYCGLLLDQQLGPLSAGETNVLLRMRHSVERLSRMAEDMFQLTVGNRCDPKPNLEDMDLSACINQAVHEVRPFIDEKQLQITLDIDISPRPARIDPSQIEQVLINILDNASKFTPRHGSIDVKGYPFFWERRWTKAVMAGFADRRRAPICAPNSYRIDIHDTGPSIPPEQLSSIFEEYTSCKGGQDRSGAGLGLAICKLIISRHKGRVWAESNGLGNLFSIVLPFGPGELDSVSLAS